jgi:hypothetical protein
MLFNRILSENYIPNDLKCALVTPLYKGKGSKHECTNYRDISILSPVTKLFETVIYKQLNDYFASNDHIVCNQHGFRKRFSCETALHELLNGVNLTRDQKKHPLLLFNDFRKAFNTVNSDILLRKLRNYGFDTNALSLLENYFSNRSQVTKLDCTLSDPCKMSLGVPQGSILGPLSLLMTCHLP